jgi:hypothetical protein
MALIVQEQDAIGMDKLRDAFAQAQVVLMRVAQYSEHIAEVQMGCNYPQQIIELQWQITELQRSSLCPHAETIPSWSNGYTLPRTKGPKAGGNLPHLGLTRTSDMDWQT